MAELQTRALDSNDRGVLAEMLGRVDNFRPDEVDVALELIDDCLANGGASYRVLVATLGERVVGYVCFGVTPMTDHTWDLYWIVSDPTARGRGVGRRLWEAMRAEIEAEGARNVRIETSSTEGYGGTNAFYEALGFRVLSVFPDFYRAGDDLITWVWRRA